MNNGEATHPPNESNGRPATERQPRRAAPPSKPRSDDRPHAKDADPGVIAAELLATLSSGGLPLVRFWGGAWWNWSDGRYIELPEAELRAEVIRHFKLAWSHIKREHVANVIEHLRADTILDSDVSPPLWLTGTPIGFTANECLATARGIIHLPSLAEKRQTYCIPASPNFFTLSAVGYDIDLDAEPPIAWLAFLQQLWPNDPQSVETLQELFGLLLTADTQYQKIFAIIGPPRSGKGTIARLLRKLVGDQNVAGPTLAGLSGQFGLATLVGKPLAIVSDARLSGRVDSSLVVERLLAISGEDKQTIDRKFLPAIHCQLPSRFLILSNELPRLADSSGTIVSRFVLLRTTNSFLGAEDTALDDKLAAELPGILLWAIEGLRRLRERGKFVQPASGAEMLNGMVQLASPIMSFVNDCCELGLEYKCSKRDLFMRYRFWADLQGIARTSTAEIFSRDLFAAFPQIRTTRVRVARSGEREYCFEGLRLSDGDV